MRLIAVPLPSVPGVIAFRLGVIASRLGVIASMHGVVAFSLAVIAFPIAFNGGLVYNHTVTITSTTHFIISNTLSSALVHFIIVFDTHFIAFWFTLHRMTVKLIVFIHYIIIQE